MRIAVAQFAAGMNKAANLERIADLSARAADPARERSIASIDSIPEPVRIG